MQPQFRNTVERMYRGTFFYNFNNRPILSRRNTVWLCYEVKTRGPSMPTWDTKIFRGQVPRSLIRAPFQVLSNPLAQCPPPHGRAQVQWLLQQMAGREQGRPQRARPQQGLRMPGEWMPGRMDARIHARGREQGWENSQTKGSTCLGAPCDASTAGLRRRH
ncbi:DNA dC-_dU-editing enzyme APOBEC-3F isoform X6 [Macaca mulatta]